MQRHPCLLLAVMLAFAPGVSAAEIPAGVGLASPARPFAQGFSSLFKSAAPATIRGPAGLVPPNAPATAAPRRQPGMAVGMTAPGGVCRPALIAAEARYGIPTGLLQAIGLVESGRRDEGTGTRQPWPW